MAKYGLIGILAVAFFFTLSLALGLTLGALGVEKALAEFIINVVALVSVPIFIFIGFYVSRRRRKRMGLKSYRIWKFVLPMVSGASLRTRARKLSDEELLGAFYLPDHTKRAKGVVTEELLKRGLRRKDIVEWRPQARQLTVGPIVRGQIEPRRYFSMVRTRRRLLQFYRIGIIVLLLVILLWFGSIGSLGPQALLGLIVAASFLTVGLLMPVLFLAVFLGRNRAVRILLLRSFGHRKVTGALKRIIVREVGSIGPVFTLSDRNFKPNVFITIAGYVSWVFTYTLGPLLRPSIKLASVRWEPQYLSLVDHLSGKIHLSLKSFLSGGQALSIKSTDAWWQIVMNMLMNSCDIVVMDVSRVNEGSAWEIEALEEWKLLERVIFIAAEEHYREGKEAITCLLSVAVRPILHVYDKGGNFRDAKEFRRCLEEVVNRVLIAWAKPRLRVRAVGQIVSRITISRPVRKDRTQPMAIRK